MDNSIFVDHENKPIVTHNDKEWNNDYDDDNTPNTSGVDETTFTTPGSTDKQDTWTLQLRQKVEPDKLGSLYRH